MPNFHIVWIFGHNCSCIRNCFCFRTVKVFNGFNSKFSNRFYKSGPGGVEIGNKRALGQGFEIGIKRALGQGCGNWK